MEKCWICCNDEGGTKAFCVKGSVGFQVVLQQCVSGLVQDVGDQIWLCMECGGVIEDVEDLHRLVEKTQRTIEERVRWVEERMRQRRRTTTGSSNNEVDFQKVEDSCGEVSYPVNVEGYEDLEAVDFEVKTEPVELDNDSFDFALPLSDGEDKYEDFSVKPFLEDGINKRCKENHKEGRNNEDLKDNEWKLVQFWGLDKKPQLVLCVPRLPDSHSVEEFNQVSKKPCKATGVETGIRKSLRKRKHSTIATTVFEEGNEQDKDSDYDLTSEHSDSESEDSSSGASDRSSLRGQTSGRPEPFFPVIKDGKMWFGRQKIVERDNFFHCCYESCEYKVEKCARDEQSCRLIMEHMKAVHIGSGMFSCRRCVIRFKTRQEYFLHYARNHRLNNKDGNPQSNIPNKIRKCKNPTRSNNEMFPEIKDGRMWLGTKEIIQVDDFLHCCYNPCEYKVPKAKDELESCKLIMEHLQAEHIGSGIFGCRRCQLRFSTKKSYFVHYSKNHRNPLKSDKNGSKWITTNIRRRKPIVRPEPLAPRINDGKMYFCDLEIVERDNFLYCCYESCDFKTEKSEDEKESCRLMQNHLIANHTGSGAYSCRQCKVRFESVLDYQKHYADTHRNKKVLVKRQTGGVGWKFTNKTNCDICGRPLMAGRGMKKHKWSHMSDAEKAEWVAAGRPNPLEKERQRKEKEKKSVRHQCSTCGKRFPQANELALHEEKHKDFSERRKFICDLCGAVMITFNGLRIHKRLMHDRESLLGKWKVCHICPDAKFLTRTLLNIHMMRFHGAEKTYKCDKCDKCFSDTGTLKRHKQTHMNLQALFKCSDCPDRSYRYDKSLQRHIKSAHPEKFQPRKPLVKKKEKLVELTCKQMYPCSVCDKLFELPSRLKKHAKSHETSNAAVH